MIRALLALDGALVRGALAFVLSAEDDIDVVAEVDRGEDPVARVRSLRPDVTVADLALLAAPIEGAWRRVPSPLLVLASPRQGRALAAAVRQQTEPCGFLGDHVQPQRVVDGVRHLAHGEPVVDAHLVVAALDRSSPLTERELEVLAIAASGWPAKEIAEKLSLSTGTVRNYLSRVVTKCGARTRIEAVRIAQEAGWI